MQHNIHGHPYKYEVSDYSLDFRCCGVVLPEKPSHGLTSSYSNSWSGHLPCRGLDRVFHPHDIVQNVFSPLLSPFIARVDLKNIENTNYFITFLFQLWTLFNGS
jgi:hypothetical protein